MENNYIQIFNSKNINTLNISDIPESQLFITIEKILGQPDRCEELLAWPSKEKSVISHFQKIIASEISEDRYFLLQIDLDISISEFNSMSANAEFIMALDSLINAHVDGDYIELHQRLLVLEVVLGRLHQTLRGFDQITARQHLRLEEPTECFLFS